MFRSLIKYAHEKYILNFCTRKKFGRYKHHNTRKGFYDEEKPEKLFNLLKNQDSNLLLMPKFKNELKALGLKENDPRLIPLFAHLTELKSKDEHSYYNGVNLEQFKNIIKPAEELIIRAFEGSLVITNWSELVNPINEIYKICLPLDEGQVANYIPQLALVDPANWGVSICTIDGQRMDLGNYKDRFTFQSMSKPIIYAIAVDHLGAETVHKYVGREPSGRNFNEMILNPEDKPHNPMINSGAIVVCSLVHSLIHNFGSKPSTVFQNTKQYFDKLANGLQIGFNTSIYISEQEMADRNYAIAFYLKEHKAFPIKSRLSDTLKFYFRCCSLECTTEILALMGATLANFGVHPLTNERIFNTESVKHTLSLMYSCGMYDFSGQFAFEVGLPGKSGVSGGMVIAIPNIMGIGLWSPKLGKLGNSKRAIQFCRELVKRFPFHQYDSHYYSYVTYSGKKRVLSHFQKSNIETFNILSAASQGELHKLKKFFLNGMDLGVPDYDNRTALHLAAVEGHIECVEFLINHAKVKIDPVDRWGQTPLMIAEKSNQKLIVSIFKEHKTEKQPVEKEDQSKKNVEHEEIIPGGIETDLTTDPNVDDKNKKE